MAKKKFDVMHASGKYMKDGVEKTRWLRCGAVIQKDNGGFALKLECIPVGAEFDGWLQLFSPQGQQQQSAPAAPPPPPEFEDDIPFS